MSNPYFWLPVEKQGAVMVWLGTAAFVLMIVRYGIGLTLRTRLAGVPSRVVAMDIPFSLQRTEAKVRIWKEMGVAQRALFKTRLDYLFLLLYPMALSLACVMLAVDAKGLTALFGQMLSWGVLLCVPFGAFTNTMILRMLLGVYRSPVSHGFTALLRAVLFFLTGCSILYIAIAMSG